VAYAHGHHESVLRSHAARTVADSAAYLVSSLFAGARILDVGAGPGTITVDLADRVFPGQVVGVDAAVDVVEVARAAAAERTNVSFRVGDAYALDVPDASFDIVHAHQTLQHLARPVDALREFRRVAGPEGLVAVRDVDYGGVIWHPRIPALDEWLEIYHGVHRGVSGGARRRAASQGLGPRGGLHAHRGERERLGLRHRRQARLVGRDVGGSRPRLGVRRTRSAARSRRRRAAAAHLGRVA
jgi:SAM-dependent methyltransferase